MLNYRDCFSTSFRRTRRAGARTLNLRKDGFMNASFRGNLLVRSLGSMQLMIFLLLLFAVASGAATFIESAYGTPAARDLVYGAKWFELTILLLIVNLTIMLFARMPYRRSQIGFVLVHISMIVILVSAGITRYFGYEGMMHIREGESSSTLFSSKDYLLLGDGETQAGFPVLLWKAGPTAKHGEIDLNGETYSLRATEFWPHYTERMQPDADGPATLAFAVSEGEGGMNRQALSAGQSRRIGGTNFVFHAGPLPEKEGDTRYGELLLSIGDQSGRLGVTRDPARTATVGDFTVRILEFHADYARRNEVPAPESMGNPMVRIGIEGPGGASSERTLFAYYPDFSMDHGGAEDPFPGLHSTYDYGRRLELSAADGTLRVRATFPVEKVDMASGEVDTVLPANEPFELTLRTLHRAGNLSIVPTQFWEHASMQPGLSDNPDALAAARVEVTGPGGERSEAIVKRGIPVPIRLGDRALELTYGSKLIDVPYRVQLDDFLLLTYPGSNNPASYESHVRLYDEAAGIDGRPVRIYMNHPLTYKGFKHFQSSYDQDRKGTILSVNHDPGKWPTYIGYMLIGLGFFLLMFKGLLSRSEPARKAKETA